MTALFIAGFGHAVWAKYWNPDVYRRIGRAVD
jgi:hypothetical protein